MQFSLQKLEAKREASGISCKATVQVVRPGHPVQTIQFYLVTSDCSALEQLVIARLETINRPGWTHGDR